MVGPDQQGSETKIMRGTNQSDFPPTAHRAIAAPVHTDSVYLRNDQLLSNQVKGHAAKANSVEIDQRTERTSPIHVIQNRPLPSIQLHFDIGVMFG
jgi:hypothetical protein